MLHSCFYNYRFYDYCLSIYDYYVDILIMMISICYSWMMYGKRKKTPICAKIGIVMPLLIFNIQCTNSGAVFYFDGLSMFYF
jgi:hypothetical protein